MFTKFFLTVGVVLCIIAIYFPNRHAKHYQYIKDENVFTELQVDPIKNTNPNLKNCTYNESIVNSSDVDLNSIYENHQFHKPLLGGEFNPPSCNALFSTAIIIPYRNRSAQLNVFINYMHSFLQIQNIRYRIFVVEQNDTLPFNRAKMINYGAKVAMNMTFNCLIFHDVDLIPINLGNIYACSKRPRHMSSSLDTFRYNLPYISLFGGAVSISSKNLKKVNGMSNEFYGWGGEDDDFSTRLIFNELEPYRFSPKISKYIMLIHKKEIASSKRWELLKFSAEGYKTDGLNSLSNNYLIKLDELYTLVIAT